MIPPGQLTGAVLAGGQSRRMGRDKATLLMDGQPLWQRQVRLLRSLGANPVAVVRRPSQAALGLPSDIPLWQDTVANIGPLAGLHAALAAARTDWLAVVATDMPALDGSWFNWLGKSCSTGCGAIARRNDGIFEPLAAIYPQAAMGEVESRLAGPDHSLQSLARWLVAQQRLVAVPLPAANAGQVVSWNTPADAGLTAAD
ncbi:MAG TPA: molybdenum cofactor guanylyltransferase [Lacunisphaera sp.]|nr:molybdenum cofactor guanylyltransferase [Lacunisphaera sp.]